MRSSDRSGMKYALESLESRVLLSLVYDAHGVESLSAAAKGGGKPTPPAPEIRLDLVAVHEFGHSLGLGHSSDPASIMYAYYNAGYDLASFAADSAVAAFQSLYSSESSRPWKDALDADGGVTDGDVDLTYSFVRDGARMDQGGRSNLFAAFDALSGAGNWQGVFATALNHWASASNGTLSVHPFDSDGIENATYNFNASGAVQNDPRFGDIRIAAHKFDGAGNVLAHTYYPPPNGITAAGDAHFDSGERWILSGSSSSSTLTATAPAPGGNGNAVALGTLGTTGVTALFADGTPITLQGLLAATAPPIV